MILISLDYIMIEGRRINITKRKEKCKCTLLRVQCECKLFLIFSDSMGDFANESLFMPLQPCEPLWSLQLPDFQQLNATVWAQFLQVFCYLHC